MNKNIKTFPGINNLLAIGKKQDELYIRQESKTPHQRFPISTTVLFVIIALKFFLQYIAIAPIYELHRDEYLHIDQGQHLAWGYLSVPPVTSWLSAIILLFGKHEWLVKFFPALFGAITIVVVWKTVAFLRGGLYAQILAAAALLFSALLRLNTLYQPNSLDILLWTVLLAFLIRYIHSGKPKWLYFMAIIFAAGFLNKYNIVFLLAGLLPALLLSPQRRLFTSKHLYFSILLALLLIAPNLLWQIQNGFPVVHHMQELAETQLEHSSRSRFLQEQLLFYFGSVYVLIAGMIALLFWPRFRDYRLLATTLVFTLLLFLYFKAKGYYAVGLYPIYMAFGAVYLEALLQKSWKKYLKPALIIIPVLALLPIFSTVLPVKTPEEIRSRPELFQKLGLLYWEDGKEHALPQDFADMLGWKELAEIVDKAYASTGDPEHTIVLCDNYGEAGAVNYYSSITHINAVSMNADYINWFRLDKPVRHVILVKGSYDKDPERKRERDFFETVSLAGIVTHPYAREKGAAVFVLKNANVDVNKILSDEIRSRKAAMKF